MKKHNNFQFNTEKMINDEEMKSFRGGAYNVPGVITCYSSWSGGGCMGYLGQVTGTCSSFGDEQAICIANGYTGTYCTAC